MKARWVIAGVALIYLFLFSLFAYILRLTSNLPKQFPP